MWGCREPTCIPVGSFLLWVITGALAVLTHNAWILLAVAVPWSLSLIAYGYLEHRQPDGPLRALHVRRRRSRAGALRRLDDQHGLEAQKALIVFLFDRQGPERGDAPGPQRIRYADGLKALVARLASWPLGDVRAPVVGHPNFILAAA